MALLITPRSVLRRHARLIAWKWTYPSRRPSRPPKPEALRHLVVRLARENPGHGGVPAGCGGGVVAVRRYALGLMPRARLNAALNANASE
ncbi:hypothetical protein GCM10010246_79410 [Streptomyces cuspidosporus]|uniref:Transposase n=1 Tax=Streptomyces cuspidosporus TaxID=66882 RepID=A0ABN3H906_9ACTN